MGGEQMTEYFSLEQAKNYMGFKSYDALKRYIELGLPVITVGRSKRISKTAIDKFMADHTVIAGQDTKAAK